MTDIKLFSITAGNIRELRGSAVALEKSLQVLIEENMASFLGVRFLASELPTSNGGRMDSVGIDENGSPVIVEYKRASNENVINQGLFYLDWLMDHRRDFEWLVMEKFGADAAKAVDWSAPRLICIAGDFSKYDSHAVNQMNRNVALVRYRRYGEDLLLFEMLTSVSERAGKRTNPALKADEPISNRTRSRQKTVTEYMSGADSELIDLYEALKAYLVALGDDVEVKTLDNYIAFRRLKNFACVEVKPQIRQLKVYLKSEVADADLEPGFSRNVSKIGHYGTGNLEILITDERSFEKAKPFIDQSYEIS